MGPVARVLAHPLRLLPNGSLGTVETDTDAHHAQELAVLVSTRRGERPLAPTFGITDPAFAGVDPAELAAQVAVFGPPVTITGVTTTYNDTGDTADVLVTFD
jgi:hypothetical protein